MISAGIEYLEQGSGAPIIFMHGIGGGANTFDSQLENLSNYRRISWNMPGYGSSEANPWPPSFESLSSSLARFIESLSLTTVHLVGQSIGGMIALEHALRRADQVATLTLIASTPRFGSGDDSFKNEFLKARLAPLDEGMTMAQLAAKAAPALTGTNTDEHCMAEIERIMSKISLKTWRGILQTLVTFDRKTELDSIAQPCCVIAGSDDNNSPAKTLQKMASALPNAEFHLIDGAGHMVNQEAPDMINTILNRFIGQHTP